MSAARWNGAAHQNATGAVRTATTQPQFGNWNAGNMEIRKMGTPRIVA